MRLFTIFGFKRAIISFIMITGTLDLVLAAKTMALPNLQINIVDGVYDNDPNEQSIVTNASSFTLQALGLGSTIGAGAIAYFSISIVDSVQGSPGDYTGITVNGSSLNFNWGTPPSDVYKNQDLPSHSIYDSWYAEIAFTFGAVGNGNIWNIQGGTGSADGSINDFLVDLTGFWASNPDATGIHFDLYTKNPDGSIDKFAPFSHDGTATAPVPEPATLTLLGIGLVGLVGSAARRKWKKTKSL